MQRSLSKRLAKAVIVAISITLGALTSHLNSSNKKGSEISTNEHFEAVTLERVLDGDTLVILYRGKRERLRLIGVDAPESIDTQKAHREAKKRKETLLLELKRGEEAKRYLSKLLSPGEELRIEFDQETRDKYGRILGYVYLPSEEMLNTKIIEDGYAHSAPIGRNLKYRNKLKAAAKNAQIYRRGLWANYPNGPS